MELRTDAVDRVAFRHSGFKTHNLANLVHRTNYWRDVPRKVGMRFGTVVGTISSRHTIW
jgi:hypothetical protein